MQRHGCGVAVALIIGAIILITIVSIQTYNFFALKKSLEDEKSKELLQGLETIDDEEALIAKRRIIDRFNKEGYLITMDNIEFRAEIPGNPRYSEEIFQVSSNQVKKPMLTIIITLERKWLIFNKEEKVILEKKLKSIF